MFRRIIIPAAAVLVALYLDSILFQIINIKGIRPDAIMAVVAAVSILRGSKRAAVYGLVCGLLTDILYSGMVGISSIGYMICGAVGGMFYQKYFADNLVFPACIAAVGAFIKEHIMMIASIANGAKVPYFSVLMSYILPSMILTVALCIPTHIIMKRVFSAQVRNEKIKLRDMREKSESGGLA